VQSTGVRIGLIGLDHWYSAFPFAAAVAAHDEATLVAVADADPERAREVARRNGVERVTARWEELVEDPEIDAIASFISVDRNPAVCIAAARSGKHILSIKPLALTLPEASAIREAVHEADVVFLPAESRGRLAEQNQRLKGWLAEGRLGRILTAGFSLWAGIPQRWPGDPDPGWFADAQRAPGGGWIDHSIYHIDLLRWLLGSEVQQVSGRAGKLKYPDLPVEDFGTATVTFEDGAIATLEDTWLAQPGAFRTTMSLVGSEGIVAYDSLSGRLSVAGDFPPFSGWVQTAALATYTEGLDHFLGAIRGDEEAVATVEDAWRNLAVCRAFYDAAASGGFMTPANL